MSGRTFLVVAAGLAVGTVVQVAVWIACRRLGRWWRHRKGPEYWTGRELDAQWLREWKAFEADIVWRPSPKRRPPIWADQDPVDGHYDSTIREDNQ